MKIRYDGQLGKKKDHEKRPLIKQLTSSGRDSKKQLD